MNLETLIATSLNRPARNIYGDLGPRCPTCSGLGHYLTLGGQGNVTKATKRCECEGTGLDLIGIERMDRDLLWKQIHRLESKAGLKLTSRYRFPNLKMSRQYWMECIAWATADGVAVASSTTETILFPNVTIPANYMQDGRGLRLKVAGKYGTLGSGTVTHIYQVRWNGVAGTTICKTGTVTLVISLTNAYFEIEVMIQTRSNGSSGTLLGDGRAHVYGATAPTLGSATGSPAEAPLTAGGQTGPAVATVDLTADSPLSITIQHGANSASNTATGQHYTIESLN